MVKCPEMIREFEDEQLRRNPADFHSGLRVFEALWEHAVTMKVLPPADPLEGLEVDLRLAEALNVR